MHTVRTPTIETTRSTGKIVDSRHISQINLIAELLWDGERTCKLIGWFEDNGTYEYLQFDTRLILYFAANILWSYRRRLSAGNHA